MTGLTVREFSERFGDWDGLYGKQGRIRKGLATTTTDTPPALGRNGLRCRWQVTAGKLRAVWVVR